MFKKYQLEFKGINSNNSPKVSDYLNLMGQYPPGHTMLKVLELILEGLIFFPRLESVVIILEKAQEVACRGVNHFQSRYRSCSLDSTSDYLHSRVPI